MITGFVLGGVWIALGLATGWFGIPVPWSFVVSGGIGFLCTFTFGPMLERAAHR